MLPSGAAALWDALNEGHAPRTDMLCSFAGWIDGQPLLGLAATSNESTAHIALTVLLITSLVISITVQMLADLLAGTLDRLAFSQFFTPRTNRATLRPHRCSTAAAVSYSPPGRYRLEHIYQAHPLGHYGDRTKPVANPLTVLPMLNERLANRNTPNHPLKQSDELHAVLANHIRWHKLHKSHNSVTTAVVKLIQLNCISHTCQRFRPSNFAHRYAPGAQELCG